MEFSPLRTSFSEFHLALRLKVSLLGIIPEIATFTVSALMFLVILIMLFAIVSGSSFDGKLLLPQ